MINGGFVPEPETVLQDGVVYAPLEKSQNLWALPMI